MKKIKNLNGYAIYEAGQRDVTKYGFAAGSFYVYFASDIRDFGLSGSPPEFEDCGSLEEAEANCAGNFAIAKEIVEGRTTAASMEEILEVEAQLDAGVDPDNIDELDELEAVADVIAKHFPEEPTEKIDELADRILTNIPGISPETLDALLTSGRQLIEAIIPALEQIMAVAKQAFEALASGIGEAIGCFNGFTDAALYAACEDPKHWHYYKHAKKARTRKKYRHRLERSLARAIAASEAERS
jgi:hypothetical protein